MATPPRHSAASGPEPDEPHDDPHALPRRRRGLTRFDLSVTQLVATGLAATTATVAASFLGVAGTVVGAALFSIMTAVGKAVYEQSLSRTRDRVRGAVPVLAPRSATRSLPVTRTASHPTASHPTASPAQVPPDLPAPAPVRSVVWKRAAFGAVSVFAVVLAIVTGVEAVAGRPISDVVRGESGGGTTFFGNNQVRTKTVPPTTPTVTVTVTPKVEVTTPTVTQTAPAVTRTNTPSATTSGSAPGSGTPSTSTSTPTRASSSSPAGESASRGR